MVEGIKSETQVCCVFVLKKQRERGGQGNGKGKGKGKGLYKM